MPNEECPVSGARTARPTARGRLRSFCRALRGCAIAAALLPGFGSLDAHARTLGEILDRNAFSICADPNALPFSSRTGNSRGLQIDLAQIITERLGVQLDVGWVTFRRGARAVDCDAIMSSIARGTTAEHNELPEKTMGQSLTRPYAHMTTRLVARDGAPSVTSFADLRKITVAVPPASYLHYLLDTNKVPVRTLYRTDLDILEAVAGGEVSAGIVSDWNLGWFRIRHPDAGISMDDGWVLDPDLDYDVAITLRNTDQDLLNAVNRILGGLMSDGGMTDLFEKYGIRYRPPLAN
jgi:polar amino acid transport system substrate-binding protein